MSESNLMLPYGCLFVPLKSNNEHFCICSSHDDEEEVIDSMQHFQLVLARLSISQSSALIHRFIELSQKIDDAWINKIRRRLFEQLPGVQSWQYLIRNAHEELFNLIECIDLNIPSSESMERFNADRHLSNYLWCLTTQSKIIECIVQPAMNLSVPISHAHISFDPFVIFEFCRELVDTISRTRFAVDDRFIDYITELQRCCRPKDLDMSWRLFELRSPSAIRRFSHADRFKSLTSTPILALRSNVGRFSDSGFSLWPGGCTLADLLVRLDCNIGSETFFVCDIGAGSGISSILLSKTWCHHSGLHVIATDFDDRVLENLHVNACASSF